MPGLTYLLELPRSAQKVNCTKFVANVTAVKPDFYDKFIDKHGAVSEEHIGHLLHSINETIGSHLTNAKVKFLKKIYNVKFNIINNNYTKKR